MATQMISMKNGSLTIPDDLRQQYGIEDDSLLVIEAGIEGIVLRPADWPEVEIYTPERIAEFLLNNAIDEVSYKAAVEEVLKMRIDPSTIPHDPPPDSSTR